MKLVCIKDVMMDESNRKAFTKDKVYPLKSIIETVDDQDLTHYIKEESFIKKHFEVLFKKTETESPKGLMETGREMQRLVSGLFDELGFVTDRITVDRTNASTHEKRSYLFRVTIHGHTESAE